MITLDWEKANGLITTVVQDATTKQVLMVAYMNQESLAKTMATGETWFWSRSRKTLWHKGATSGNIQTVKQLQLTAMRTPCSSPLIPPAQHAIPATSAVFIVIIRKGRILHDPSKAKYSSSI
ncbi:phosphoribosyl-AMP cyclohydrolase [Lacticaseibacillus paracasei subsp. paracasei Lpp229]|nr:phosphoribosyl-AMP cyclohydrolase [Lacticaseibacillus paracasei subsp. paracasei Lpp229]